MPEPRPRVIRPEIQALRAAAVTVVVLFHLWPEVLTGGFVGVDVFFVISGYLITDHLLREVDRTGRIALPAFWARRARRLLPASLLVLLVSAVGVLIWVPQVFWMQFFREAIASALYVENWVLAADSVEYLAANNVATAAQHYWSLSVEEQFYVVWPLLILAAIWIAGRFARIGRGPAIVLTLALVAASSLVASVIATSTNPASAYFVTPTRAWEFGLGGLLACLPAVTGRLITLRIVVAWLGWAAIAFASMTYSSATPFPGSAALVPVLGTAAVIWAGAPDRWWAPTRLVGLRPVQWTGDVSYSMYLWHWPLVIIAPYVVGQAQLSIAVKAPLLVLTIVLAWLTKRWVEDPVRTGRLLATRPPRWTFLATVGAMAVVVVPSLIGGVALQERVARDDQERARLASSPCYGAASLSPALDCSDVEFDVISPDPALAPQDSPAIYFTDPPCFAEDSRVRSCDFGTRDSTVRVALVGDSHAAQWQPALQRIAEKHDWDLDLYLKTNCAFTSAERGAAYDSCAEWSEELQGILAGEEPYDLVLTSFFAENLGLEVDAGILSKEEAVAGFARAWQPLIERGAIVVAIADTPHMRPETTVCVATAKESFDACSVPRSEAFAREDLQAVAAATTAGAVRLDLSHRICTTTVCDAVVGGVALYTDPFHLTETYARTVAPYLERDLASVLEASGEAAGAAAAAAGLGSSE
ncbi:MAG: acyltransferase [Agromyces sp.]|nr:acyltransferase [Agromyces sp.]